MRPGPFVRRLVAAACLGAGCLLLAACAGPGGTVLTKSVGVATEASKPAGSQAQQAPSAFQDRQRSLAEAAEQQGQWARAAWAWEALHAVRPDDDAVAARLQKAQRAAESRATLLSQQARLTLQLGDNDGARDLFMRALTVLPTHGEAIEGLRALEDGRVRRQFVEPEPARATPPRSAQARTATEFASLLMAQAEYQRAAELLQPLANGAGADPATRRQLSDVYLLMAEAQHGDDSAAALANVRRSLEMDPRNARAGNKLRDWQKRSAPPVPSGRTSR